MAEFFSSRLLRMLIAPYRSRMVNMASRPFYQVADRVLGSQFLEDIAEFFILFQTMYAGLRRAGPGRRAAAPRPAHHLRGREHPGGGAGPRGRVLHRGPHGQAASTSAPWSSTRCCRTTCSTTAAEARAARLCDDAAELAASDDRAGRSLDTDEAQLARVLRRDRGELPQLRGRGPARGRAARTSWRSGPTWWPRVPEFDADIHDLPGLLRLGERIWALGRP